MTERNMKATRGFQVGLGHRGLKHDNGERTR